MVGNHGSRICSLRGRKACIKQQEERDEEEEERGESTKLWESEEGQLVRSIFEVLMNTEREEEVVEREAWCITGSPLVVYAYSSIVRGWLELILSQLSVISYIKKEGFKLTLKCREGICLLDPN